MLTQIVGRVAKLCSRVESMVEEVRLTEQGLAMLECIGACRDSPSLRTTTFEAAGTAAKDVLGWTG